MTERTPEQYAIEHGRYLAVAAERFIAACNKLEAACDEAEDDETAESMTVMCEAIDAQHEACRRLKLAIHEFIKRADRAYPISYPMD